MAELVSAARPSLSAMDTSPDEMPLDSRLAMLPEHQRLLTSALLRVVKAGGVLAQACIQRPVQPWSWSAEIAASDINLFPAWDGNVLHRRLLGDLGRGCESAREHGLALFELARSTRALSVPLATVTRGAIEAYSRVFWLLSAERPEECVRRLASLEHKALFHGERRGAKLRRLPFETEATLPVADHRALIASWADHFKLKLEGGDPTRLAIDFLEALYPGQGAYTYFGLSGAAHANEWATANFYDFKSGRLRRDDKMLMEYCMYVIEASRQVCDLLIQRFEPDAASSERWAQAYGGALRDIDGFITRTRDPV